MIVADLLALMTAAKQFAEAADAGATVKNKLAAACAALEPFHAMDVAAFGELVKQAEEYKRTGLLPVSTKPVKAPKAAKAAAVKPTAEEKARQIDELVQQLNALMAVVHEDSVGYGAIDQICDAVGKLDVSNVRDVVKGFGIKVAASATKKKCLDEIKRKLTEQKGSAQRIQPISAS
ncbi:MAG: hypothetical protein ACRDD1_09775 [Planctomycetia bacterium]